MAKKIDVAACQAMRATGLSFAQIAQHYDVSRQCVQQALKRAENSAGPARRGRKPSREIYFANLNQWAKAQDMSINEMEKRTGVCLYRGLTTGHLSQKAINAVLGLTGLTYEEAFESCKQ